MAYPISASTGTDDRGAYRILDLSPGEYFIVAVQGTPGLSDAAAPEPGRDVHTSIYPGVRNLKDAVAVVLRGGQVDLGNLILGEEPAGVIEFHYANTAGLNIESASYQISGSPNWARLGGNLNRGWVLTDISRTDPLVPEPALPTSARFYTKGVPGPMTVRATLNTADGPRNADAWINFSGADVRVDLNFSTREGSLTVEIIPPKEGANNAEFVRTSVSLRPVAGTQSGHENAIIHNPSVEKIGVTKDPANAPVMNRTIPEGAYVIDDVTNLPPGWYVSTASQDGREALSGGVIVRQGSRLEIGLDITHSTLKGIVTDSQQHPVHGAIVVLAPMPPLSGRIGGLAAMKTTHTDQQGAYLLRDVIPGPYRVFALGEGESDEYVDLDQAKKWMARAESVQFGNADGRSVNLRILDEAPK